MTKSPELAHTEESRMASFRHRTLENACRPLIPYLDRPERVLDVGCGEGRITVDVAKLVRPGAVFGVDAVDENVKKSSGTD